MGATQGSDRAVILYELNEVPWSIVDRFVQDTPGSTFAQMLAQGASWTTVSAETVPLQPWRTWPTFHRSMYAADHHSMDLGQDPATFGGEPMWATAAAAGRRVGVFGSLQSWPACHFPGGFHLPDTFARDADAYPPQLSRFQRFNLAMTAENTFSSNVALNSRQMAAAAVDLATKGLRPSSGARVVRHLVRERRDGRYKGARSSMQALPYFDLFWRLHRKHRPQLSQFFTNHVASAMHRYWGDAMEGYAEAFDYTPDPVKARFIPNAMGIVDRQLTRLARFASANPGTTIVIASSMGQGPVEHHEIRETYVLDDPEVLARRLGLTGAQIGLAMYPRSSYQFPDTASAEAAASALLSVTNVQGNLFRDLRTAGTTVSFLIQHQPNRTELPAEVSWRDGSGASVDGTITDIGVVSRSRLGGGNTAFHIPQGILIAVGGGVRPDRSRHEVSVLDAAPSILDLIGVAPASTMQGSPSLFQAASATR